MRKSILCCLLIGLVIIVLRSFWTKRIPEGVGIESFRYETYGMMAGTEMSLSILREEDDSMILDGESFRLTIAFDDGTIISARGTNRRPKGMGQALREIENLFDQLLWETEQ